MQGVGFRPFVYRLARQRGLGGFVRNDGQGVTIEVQGARQDVEAFGREMLASLPPLAVVKRADWRDVAPDGDQRAFEIIGSDIPGGPRADVTVDTALCDDCRREMLSPADRRFGYALINCTNCGPRYSIVQHIPYDRPNTTMAVFAMCDRCRDEYTNPADRRFHAQPIACHDCGPAVRLVDSAGAPIDGQPIAMAARVLARGQVLAVKGIGGFHLAVRADDQAAVRRLRRLKKRDHKPFALMCRDIACAEGLVELGEAARAAMLSPACPIVLARRLASRERKRADAGSDGGPPPYGRGSSEGVGDAVAPGSHRLGVMLPYTPIHHLLYAAGAPDVLVMTSGNSTDEPLATGNDEAISRLGPMCDAILLHDRGIQRCVDDSVVIDMAEQPPLPVRRSRGYAPSSLALPVAGEAMGLCVGGELKNTMAVVRDGRAILSQHLGDLTHVLALENFRRAIDDMLELFGVAPRWIAHDLHPIYLSTAHARALASQRGIELIGVQHHHAHAASLLAEHGEAGPILAVVCDGTGYGEDGTIWGGELLLADLKSYRRLAGLMPLKLPGGDAAAKDTRRCAAALLQGIEARRHEGTKGGTRQEAESGIGGRALRRLFGDAQEREMISAMLASGTACAVSSGAGRYFDGVVALLGLCERNHFEAQAGMAMEAAAEDFLTSRDRKGAVCDCGMPPLAYARRSSEDVPRVRVVGGGLARIDLSGLVLEIARRVEAGDAVGELAWLFHDQLAAAWEQAVVVAAERHGVHTVGLTGGVFCNALLTRMLSERLSRHSLRVLRHEVVPPNDGGLALGQAAVAAARWADRKDGA